MMNQRIKIKELDELKNFVTHPARIRGTHHHSFKRNEWADILGVRMCTPFGYDIRAAFECRYKDGSVDYIPISDAPNYEISK